MLFKRRAQRPSEAKAPPGPKPPLHKRFIKDWVIPLALVAAVLTPLRASIADWNDVPSGSMRPTILEGDRIYVNKLAYGLRIPFTTTWLARWDSPARGEVVTLKSPADGVRLVKRVVGLPGDRIAMRSNQLIINGQPAAYSVVNTGLPMHLSDGRTVRVNLEEEDFDAAANPGEGGRTHLLTITPGALSPSTFPEFTVPQGQFFVMGDNRDMSRDSRAIGFIPLSSIYGRSAYVALSVDPENYYRPRFSRWFSELK